MPARIGVAPPSAGARARRVHQHAVETAGLAFDPFVFFFEDPQGGPAFLLQPAAGTFLAYSGICTHNGCTVGYDEAAAEFACPCHGARFEVATGEPVQGPAQQPLAKIAVVESGGTVSYA